MNEQSGRDKRKLQTEKRASHVIKNVKNLTRNDWLYPFESRLFLKVSCAMSMESRYEMSLNMSYAPIKDGEFTSTIYGLIKDEKYNDAIRVLQYELQRTPHNRAALSLLGYCYYYTQDYVNAYDCYQELSESYPNYPEYKLYYSQSLYQAFCTQEALLVAQSIDDPDLLYDVVRLEAAIKYREEDMNNARILVEQYPPEDPDINVNLACLDYKDKNYDEALDKFNKATSSMGYQPELAYAIALCHYRKNEYPQAMKHITDILDRGVKDHPELGVGMVTEGIELRSVGNTIVLHESALVEALNLKFAIEYEMKKKEAAAEALTDMPPRNEEEWDPVTLHNHALLAMETNPSDGFAKLQYLVNQNPSPPETFANLLLLYCKHGYFEIAADLLAESAHLTYKLLTPFVFDYIDAVIMLQTSPEEAYSKFDRMANEQENELKRLTKKIKDTKDKDVHGLVIEQFDDLLLLYLPVIFSQAKIFWDKGNYAQVEKIFRRSAETCSEHETWRLNMAHNLFMQEKKLNEAAGFYGPIVNKNYDRIMEISPIIPANLCVCYIMTNQNEEAEELMRKVEREEEELIEIEPGRKVFHVCTINLVIGTLYCSKTNYEFGLSRVIKALDPMQRKLGTDTWFYAKRCMLDVIELMSKHLVIIRDSVVNDMIKFLEDAELHGREIPTLMEGPLPEATVDSVRNTVTYEARLIKSLLLQVTDL